MYKAPNADAELETRIDWAALALRTATTPKQRKARWAELQALIKSRSPERVKQMEQAKGLR